MGSAGHTPHYRWWPPSCHPRFRLHTLVVMTTLVVIVTSVSERVRYLRTHTGLSQRGFAGAADLPQQTIAVLELGPRENMEVLTARKICETYGCSLDWLVTGTGTSPSKRSLEALGRKIRGAAA